MFLLILAFLGEFKPEFYSERYRLHFNLDTMKFKCINENKEISIDDMEDGICNCCDGSDEILNSSFSCPNTCPIHVTNTEAGELKLIFTKGIVNRVALGQEGQVLYKELQELTDVQRIQRDELRNKADSLKTQLKAQKKAVKRWVYETNGLPMPDKKQLALERENYINRDDKVQYKSAAEDEEEEEGFSTQKIDEKAFKRRKQNRANKWDYAQRMRYVDLLNTAIEKTKITETSSNAFLAKLKVGEKVKYHPTYQAFLDLEKDYNETQHDLGKISNEVYLNELRLDQDYGEEKQWYQCYSKTVSGPVVDTPNVLHLSLMQRVYIRLPSTGCSRSNDYGAYKRRVGNLLVYETDHTDAFKGKRVIRVKTVCHPDYVVLDARENTELNADAVIGLPEICPTQYSDRDYTEWLREVQYYKKELLKGSEFDIL